MRKPPDASMSLLRTVTQEALESEYVTSSAQRKTAPLSFVLFLILAFMISYAVAQTLGGKDVSSAERDGLVAQVEAAAEHQKEIAGKITDEETQIRQLRLDSLADYPEAKELAEAELLSAAVAVSGPGIVILADDAPNATASYGQVLDSDLAILVNGLFEAGAEAVSINGLRLSTRTPIRQAGAAITVDYVSLRPPYRVEAIGDGNRLSSKFSRTWASEWWQFLRLNYGLRIDVQTMDLLELPADPGLGLNHAKGE